MIDSFSDCWMGAPIGFIDFLGETIRNELDLNGLPKDLFF